MVLDPDQSVDFVDDTVVVFIKDPEIHFGVIHLLCLEIDIGFIDFTVAVVITRDAGSRVDRVWTSFEIPKNFVVGQGIVIDAEFIESALEVGVIRPVRPST